MFCIANVTNFPCLSVVFTSLLFKKGRCACYVLVVWSSQEAVVQEEDDLPHDVGVGVRLALEPVEQEGVDGVA